MAQMKDENLCFAALFLFVLFVHVSESEATIGGWNYESSNPMEMLGHDIVSRGSIVYSFGNAWNEEFVSQTSLFERIWMFDTKSMSWSWRMSSGDIPQRRVYYCAAIRGSKIHMFGGRIIDGAAKTNDLYTFDCDSFVWKKEIIHSKEIPTMRESMSCDTFENRLYVYGGFDGSFKTDFWYFDFDAQTWNIVKPQSSNNSPDVDETQISTYKDAIFVFSGRNGNYDIVPRIWKFNITRNEWMTPFEIPKTTIKGRFDGTLSIFSDKLYHFGGAPDGSYEQQTNSIIEYNILTDRIQLIFNDASSTTFPIAFPNRRIRTSSTFVDSKLIIVGGLNYGFGYLYNDVWIFDVLTNQWTSSSLSLYPLGRKYPSITIVSEHEIGMFGGFIGWEYSALINDLWIFNTELKQWKVLSRESNCRAVNPNCAPIIDRPVFGFYNNMFYVIGSDMNFRNQYFRSFSINSMRWTSLDNRLASSKAAGLAYSLNTVIDGRIFIWGGFYSKNTSNQDMIIFDMKSESENSFEVSEPKINFLDADMASAFVMDGRFCVMDTDNSKKRGIMCWQESNNRWDVIGEVSSSVVNYPIVIGYDVSLFTFGGLSDDDSNPSELGVYDVFNKNWTIITEQERNMPGRDSASAVINKGIAYIVAGWGITRTSTIYSLELNELWCRGTQKVTASVKVVSDGSGLYRYHPGTQCRWELANVTHVVIESMALAAGANLTIRTIDQCDKDLVFNAESSSQIDLNRLAIGDAIYVPNRQSLLEFVVDSDGKAGEGFSVVVFECNAGFSARKDGGCFCGSGRFINFGGACVPCAEGSEQPVENQRFCIPKQEQQNQQVTQSTGIKSIKPSESAEIGSLPPTVVYGHAAVIGSRIFVVGGSESVDASNGEAYVSMSRVHWTSQSVDSSWMESDVAGDIPSGRIDGCFVGVGTRGILIGGRSKDGDAFVYVLDANEMKWQRRKSTGERIGSVCGSDGADVYVFGGVDKQGKIINRLSVYKPDSDSWADLMSLDGNGGGVAYGGGGVVGRYFFIFGGFDGTKESDLLRIIDLDTKTMVTRDITLDECVKCTDEGGICEFGRQRFMSFVDENGMMHAYGGVRQGEVLADMIVVELESGIVVHRENYGLSNPSLPLRHPGPKQGAAFASVGSHLVIVGGSGSNGLSANDVWTWDAGMQLWIDSSIARIPIHRTEASMCGLDEMGFVVFGGATHYIEELLLNDLWEFSLETSEWKLLYSGSSVAGPGGRAGAAMGVLSGSVFVAGGRTSLGVVDDGLWIFSMETKEWRRQVLESTLSMYQRPLQRQGAGFVWKEGRFVLWGGQIGAGTGRAEFYSAATLIDTEANQMNASQIQGAIPNRRKYHSMCEMSGNRILMHGGVDFSGSALSDSWMFDAETQSWQQLVYKHSGSFDVMKSSVCGSVGNSSVVFGTESQSGSPTAWMMQHDFGVQGKLLMSNQVDGSRGLEFQSGLVVSGVSVSFGGRNGNSMSNRVIVYRPGFCVSGSGVSISSGFQSAQFDDGSGDAMYLKNTNCVWRLENATNIVVEKRMRQVDSLRIMSLDGQTELTAIEKTQMQDGSERLVYSGSGFVVMMEASESERDTGRPCEGCFGFTITHSDCGENADFDLASKKCQCNEGFQQQEDGCVEAVESIPDEPDVGLPIGATVAGVTVISAIVGVFYRRQMKSKIEDVEKKLYGLIKQEELIIGTKLGYGAFGEVFRGEYRGADVAIKKILEAKISEKALQAFKEEISIIVELRHPNIVLFMGASFEKGSVCLVSELMQHGTLFDYLHDERNQLTLEAKLIFMQDIVKGMNYLHSNNPPILHRDLKSPNILVDDRLRLKVSDFGLSSLGNSQQTISEGISSLLWLAPEALLGREYKAPADVYSFGIVAWEIMTRKEPYEDHLLTSIPFLVISKNMRPLIPSGWPENIEQLITSSWCPDKEKRPTFTELNKLFAEYTQASSSNSFSFASLQVASPSAVKPPSGSICFVCTRIHDADLLWEELPISMGDATQIVVDLMQKLISSNRGYVSQSEGGSFVVVFQDVIDAVKFCVEGQGALQSAAWSDAILEHDAARPLSEGTLKGLRVKMGLHCGVCHPTSMADSKRVFYAGQEVSFALQLCRTARGGQILLSNSAYQEIEEKQKEILEFAIVRPISSRRSTTKSDSPIYEVFGIQMQRRAELMQEAHSNLPSIHISNAMLTESPAVPLSTNLNIPQVETSKTVITKRHQLHQTQMKKDNAERQARERMHEWQEIQKTMSPHLKCELESADVLESGTSLGSGSYGTVVVGTYKGQKVAIKKMMIQAYRERQVLLFMQEVAIIQRLDHPNIIKFVGAITNTFNLAIVLELVENGSLKDLLRDKTKLISHVNKWRIVDGIIAGMTYLHTCKPPLLHRDLKSANVLVTDAFDAKICDFGFARVKNTTRTMTKCGTLAYEAPEILTGKHYTEKVDVYSFGILLWEIETREAPYTNEDAMRIPLDVPNGKRPYVQGLKDEKIVKLMQQCWQSDPNQRPSFYSLQQMRTEDEVTSIALDAEKQVE